MVDWLSSMRQTFEHYIVDPGTWRDTRQLTTVKSCTINRDDEVETLGSASIDLGETIGECYVRTYLVTLQNGITEKHPLGTHLIQTPAAGFTGTTQLVSTDAYTPLIELKEDHPPLGYSRFKDENIVETAYLITREKVRAPVVRPLCDEVLTSDFVSHLDDTWLTFNTDLISAANYKYSLDEMGRILFAPKQDTASLQPVWTYNDDNSSILYPSISMDHDLYGIPNVVEVLYSNKNGYYHARVVNDDPNSPISTVNRGREIVHRVVDPDLIGNPNEGHVKEYANKLLRELSCLEYTVTYTHGYCPVKIGDCVRLNYTRAGFRDVKAKVISQSISCEPGCPVTEKAVFTTKLWR